MGLAVQREQPAGRTTSNKLEKSIPFVSRANCSCHFASLGRGNQEGDDQNAQPTALFVFAEVKKKKFTELLSV